MLLGQKGCICRGGTGCSHLGKSRCNKLLVGGKVVSDPEVLLGAWVGHFVKLSESSKEEIPAIEELQEKVDHLHGSEVLRQ